MEFRNRLKIDVSDQQVDYLGSHIAPFQIDDFNAKDPCLKWLAGIAPPPPIRRFWVQRARGHSKTSDEASSITWLLFAARKPVKGIGVAEDKKQAALLWDQMDTIKRHNPWLTDHLDYQTNLIINRVTGARIEIWSSDVASSWGMVPDFVVADEITHWTNSKFWVSVYSSYEKRKGMLSILCNAGFGRDWRWEIKQRAIKSQRWYHAALEGCVAPWITEESLDEQRAVIPYAEYARLWLNLWQESGGEFVTLSEAKACEDPNLKPKTGTEQDGWSYVASLDYAEKHDRTVGMVMHLSGYHIFVDRCDVICPYVRKESTKVRWCKQWMRNVKKQFGGRYGTVHFVIDKYQLLAVKEELEEDGFDITEFEFAGGQGNYRMGMALRQLIINQRVHWYPKCGQILDGLGHPAKTALENDDLTHELADLIVKQYQNGKKWRFDHLEDQIHHDDRAYALASGCLFIVENGGGYDEWDLVNPNTNY